jgi:hypothetical protein
MTRSERNSTPELRESIRQEASENLLNIHEYAARAYSVASLHEDYENALIMTQWAMSTAYGMPVGVGEWL